MKKSNPKKEKTNVPNRENLVLLLPFLLLLILAALLFIEDSIKNSAPKELTSMSTSFFTISSYPSFTTVLGENKTSGSTVPIPDENSADISAESALVMDRDSKVILFSKNATLRFSLASTTKIMTALVGSEYFKPDDILTVKTKGIQGSVVGFSPGQQYRFEDLLYGMLLPSGNDAALAIAQNYPGGTQAFIEKMNEKAQLLRLHNTHFADPAGLLDDEDYSTALDLAHLSAIAIGNDLVARIVSTKKKIIRDVSGKHVYEVANLNRLLGIDGVNGVKTGFTDEAGGVLVTSKLYGEHVLILVVMKSQDRFADTERLLSLVDGNLTFVPIRP